MTIFAWPAVLHTDFHEIAHALDPASRYLWVLALKRLRPFLMALLRPKNAEGFNAREFHEYVARRRVAVEAGQRCRTYIRIPVLL